MHCFKSKRTNIVDVLFPSLLSFSFLHDAGHTIFANEGRQHTFHLRNNKKNGESRGRGRAPQSATTDASHSSRVEHSLVRRTVVQNNHGMYCAIIEQAFRTVRSSCYFSNHVKARFSQCESSHTFSVLSLLFKAPVPYILKTFCHHYVLVPSTFLYFL